MESPPPGRPSIPLISIGTGFDCNGRCDALDRDERPERRDRPEALERVSLWVLDRPDLDLDFRAFSGLCFVGGKKIVRISNYFEMVEMTRRTHNGFVLIGREVGTRFSGV